MTPDSAAPVLLIALWMFAGFALVDTWDRFTRETSTQTMAG
jgi:hypothetical protein